MRFLITPESSSYAVERGNEVVRVELDGGAGRYRADVLHSSFKVDCQWIFTRSQYDYAMAFFRTQTQRGSLPFEIELIIEDFDLGERTAYFIPGSFKLTGQRGLAYFVSGTLEVLPEINPDETTEDAATIAAYNTAQGYSP